AIFYDSARRTVLDRLLMEITEESLSERLILQKMLVRQAVSAEIASLAREYLEQVVLKDA
ncbi:MAG TPA: hypothetical protein VFN23_09425, partial [Ktedonobacteraceae bacterium]|nr:hypothetical protein [Ktedonobacteraceae bacterium]